MVGLVTVKGVELEMPDYLPPFKLLCELREGLISRAGCVARILIGNWVVIFS